MKSPQRGFINTALVIAILLLHSPLNSQLQAQPLPATTSATTRIVVPEGPLKITVTGIRGLVQARPAADQKWAKAEVGQVLDEGAELRTGPKSMVQFTIPPDQTITLDRLGTLQILRANLENGKVFSDLGMKYGRTRYDIEAAAREHDAKVRTPNSVLAVRGTKFIAYDQTPFPPEAVSLDGRVMFKDAKKLVGVGGKNQGTTKINVNADSSAQQARSDATLNPFGEFSAQTGADLARLAGVSNFAAFGQTGQLIERIRRGEITGTFIFALPVQEELRFDLSWIGIPNSDVDLTIISPKNEILSSITGSVPSGGFHQGNTVATFPVLGPNGQPLPGFENMRRGNESAVWPISFPPGTYTVKVDLANKTANTASFTVDATRGNPQTGVFNNIAHDAGTLDTKTATATFSVSAPAPPPAAQKQSRHKR